MPSEFISPFDFKKIFLEYFLGSEELFIFAFIILVSFMCAKGGVQGKTYLILLAVGALMFSVYLGQAIYILVIFLVGFVVFEVVRRLML